MQSRLELQSGQTELCDPEGNLVGVVLSAEEYKRWLYDLAFAEMSTPEGQAEIAEAESAYRRGDCISSKQLFAEIDALLQQRSAK